MTTELLENRVKGNDLWLFGADFSKCVLNAALIYSSKEKVTGRNIFSSSHESVTNLLQNSENFQVI